MLQERGDRALNAVINTILVLLGICVLYPLWYVLICSFSNPTDIVMGRVFFWVSGFNVEGYKEMFRYTDLWIGYRNTIIYTAVATVIGLALQLSAAYALTRKNLPFRPLMNLFFIIIMYFSGGMIPSYMLMDSFGWIDNPLVAMIPGCFSVWNMIVARSYFQSSIPESLFDAAQIDGCSYIRFFVKVVLPLSSAMIAIITLYNVQGHWNSYMTGEIYFQNPQYFTLMQILNGIQNAAKQMTQNQAVIDPSALAAIENRAKLLRYTTVIVAAIPMIAIYPVVQKYFVKGVMVGSVKG